ncbi:UDP-N-acetylmuramoyl-tripeptide--D-alanyl-D-alanine ligase [Evansella caseinilytica]|uniref:UDP-N-acetylmuramoyl-tripeptide--D-alanyl-D-alanine ligase n=1 Tax=Evansella caseinilytica TaxID=1503961 RepID=A0A1H3R323_9BACI|nr:UDP-N-acetylmuramoyl-tripeptide--D-alanyl-D-alanine ligase [Evansella caseinilytica]SDZ19913.1 UDP-N-acetylmuramoyl-tripeptide--D-alanyl-D-alanine ligase [Evansella caseinilytica]
MKPLIPSIPTVGVTGSAGKSTTTNFIHAIFKTKWKNVLKTEGNLNLPKHTKQNVQKIKRYHQAVILEMGLGREAGKNHFRYIKPNIGVITNIGTAHYGKLGNSIESIARAKSAMIRYMNPEGLLLINKDDANSRLLQTKAFKGKLVTVGIKSRAPYQATNIEYLNNGMSFQVKLGNSKEAFFIPTFGNHNIINALFAIAIADHLDFTPSQIRQGLKNYRPPSRRLNVISLPKPNGALLIDDTFNANPQSVKAAVNVLQQLGKGKRKIIVLGSMLELGKYTVKGHGEVGNYLARKGIHEIFVYGKKAKMIKQAALHSGFPARNVHHFVKREHLHERLKLSLVPDAVILVKGSHRMQMKETAEFIARYSLRMSRNQGSLSR